MADKIVWVKADGGTWDEKRSKINHAIECRADAILVDEDDVAKAREIGRIKIAAFYKDGKSDADIFVAGKNSEGDGTTPLPKDLNNSKDLNLLKSLSGNVAAYVEIKGAEYEQFAIEMAKYAKYVVAIGKDWKVIPLENIIAKLQNTNTLIVAGAQNAQETKIVFETMEKGSHGVLLDNDSKSEIDKSVKISKAKFENLTLVNAKITKIKPVGIGDRACVDTCSILKLNDGLLVGSQSNGFFLVPAEVEEAPYVSPRPFRVNAGPIQAYTLNVDKTNYLDELRAGDEITIVNTEGVPKKEVIGRMKIERRPLLLIEAEVAEVKDRKIVGLLQNAETIRLFTKNKKTVSVTKLKEGDEVLSYITEGARHFGTKIEETVIER